MTIQFQEPVKASPHRYSFDKLLNLMFSIFLYRESFPYDQQFKILTRFIVDQTQTPNAKVSFCMELYTYDNIFFLM